VVDEHAEEQAADELEETLDVENPEAVEADATAQVVSDSEALNEFDQELSDDENVDAEVEEVAEGVAVGDSDEVSDASETDVVEGVDEKDADQADEEGGAGDEVVDEAELAEDIEVEVAVGSDEDTEEKVDERIDLEVDADAEVVEEAEEPAAVAEDDRHWFVVHCYSGYENKVRHNLEQRIETMGMKNKIFDVVVPTEEEIEVKDGKRRTVERRVFPGYILVQMLLDEDSWYVVRNTPGVTGFVGMGNEPTPLRQEEVSQIVKRMEAEAPRIKVTYKAGQKVRIIDGPFNDFIGTVSDIDMERAKVRVMVSFFGRETPVELDFLQVEKA
jgi:transcriptional antiterminator NusG